MTNNFNRLKEADLEEGALVRGAENLEKVYYEVIKPFIRQYNKKFARLKGQLNLTTIKKLGSSVFKSTKINDEPPPNWRGYQWYRVNDNVKVWVQADQNIFQGVFVILGDSGEEEGMFIIPNGNNPILCETKFELARQLRKKYKIYVTPEFEIEKRVKTKVKTFFQNMGIAG